MAARMRPSRSRGNSNLELFIHNRNYGYGGNQKTCYAEALRANADIVVMVHPDYQYDPTLSAADHRATRARRGGRRPGLAADERVADDAGHALVEVHSATGC